jgi:hypothetical protein
LLLPAVQKVREAARVIETHPHLAKLAGQMHAFADGSVKLQTAAWQLVAGTVAAGNDAGLLLPAVKSLDDALVARLDEANALEKAFQDALGRSPLPDDMRDAIVSAHDSLKETQDGIGKIRATIAPMLAPPR